MINYLKDTEYASKTLFDALKSEFNRLDKLKEKLIFKNNRLKHLKFDFSTSEEIEDVDGLQLQHKYVTMAKFEQDANIPKLEQDILKIAKQGISKNYGNLRHCPNGRILTTQNLKNVIWQSRNQSIHHEDGKYHKNVKECFEDLHKDYGTDFDLNANPTSNLSTKAIDQILHW